MALQLEKELPIGISANYWSISEIKVKDDELHVRIDLHISQSIKTSGKSAIESKRMIIPCSKQDVISGNVYQLAYDIIKVTEDFQGSVDV